MTVKMNKPRWKILFFVFFTTICYIFLLPNKLNDLTSQYDTTPNIEKRTEILNKTKVTDYLDIREDGLIYLKNVDDFKLKEAPNFSVIYEDKEKQLQTLEKDDFLFHYINKDDEKLFYMSRYDKTPEEEWNHKKEKEPIILKEGLNLNLYQLESGDKEVFFQHFRYNAERSIQGSPNTIMYFLFLSISALGFLFSNNSLMHKTVSGRRLALKTSYVELLKLRKMAKIKGLKINEFEDQQFEILVNKISHKFKKPKKESIKSISKKVKEYDEKEIKIEEKIELKIENE